MSVLPQIKLLINLARIDGEVAYRERQYIINIAKANGAEEDEIIQLFGQSHETIIPNDLSVGEKFDYIFKLVLLMKIDERLYAEEIKYCGNVAAKLGYKEEVMVDLMLHVHPTSMTGDEVSSLKTLTEKYLSK